jgi:hypothetical protein
MSILLVALAWLSGISVSDCLMSAPKPFPNALFFAIVDN